MADGVIGTQQPSQPSSPLPLSIKEVKKNTYILGLSYSYGCPRDTVPVSWMEEEVCWELLERIFFPYKGTNAQRVLSGTAPSLSLLP